MGTFKKLATQYTTNDFTAIEVSDFVNIHRKLILTGSFDFTGSTTLTGSLTVVGSQINYGSTSFYGNHILSGSNTIIGDTVMTGSNTIIGNTIMSGSIDVSGSSNFHNSLFIVTGSTYFKGTHSVSGSTTITGSFDVIDGNINVISGSGFYRWGNLLFNYGQFYDTTTQTGSANTAYPMRFNTVDHASGISVINDSQITVDHSGLYNLQFSAQLSNTANSNITFDIWFRITGSDHPDSNTSIDVNKSAGQLGRNVAAWNFMVPLSASQYVEIIWACNGSTGQLLSSNSGSIVSSSPAIPSVIATITQIA